MPTWLIVLLAAFWVAMMVTAWAWCRAAALTDEAMRKAIRDLNAIESELASRSRLSLEPKDWKAQAVWLNDAGELILGPKAVARIKRSLVCHYQVGEVTVYGRNLFEVADVMSRLESMRGEVA